MTLFRNRRAAALTLGLAAAALGLGWTGAHFGVFGGMRGAIAKEEVNPPDPPDRFRPTKTQWTNLKVEPVRMMSFRNTLETDGNIAYNEEAITPVFSPYSGRVTRLVAKLGDVVRKGAPLMAVESSEFVQGQNDLVGAVAALGTARAQLALADANEKRQHELYAAQAGSLKDWLQSQSDLLAAQNGLRTANAALTAARNRLRILGRPDPEIAAIETSQAELRGAIDTVVSAPIGGTVTQRQVGLGQYITSAANGASSPVYAIGDLSTVWLVANVREPDAAQLKIGQPVEVRVLAYPDRVFKAKLVWIASAIDPVTRRLPVRAEVDNRDGALKPQMFATFSIVTGNESTAPGVPQSAVVYEGADAHVFIAREDGTIAASQVRVGRSRDGMLEVVSGLAGGEKVIVSGTLFIDRAIQAH
jgi:cobalt-zinc-cadmium efflux system membrane fusion protein